MSQPNNNIPSNPAGVPLPIAPITQQTPVFSSALYTTPTQLPAFFVTQTSSRFASQLKAALDNNPLDKVKNNQSYSPFFKANREAEDLIRKQGRAAHQRVADMYKAWLPSQEYFRNILSQHYQQQHQQQLMMLQAQRAAAGVSSQPSSQTSSQPASLPSSLPSSLPHSQQFIAPPIRPPQPKPTAEQLAATAAQAKSSLTAAKRQKSAAQLLPGGVLPSTGVPRVFLPVYDPKNNEEKDFLPKTRLKSFVKDTCGNGVKLSTETEKMMKLMAGHFVQSAVSFSMSMAKRKKEKKLDANDVGFYFKKVWKISIPGLQQGNITPYRRLMPNEAYKARMAMVRKANIEAGKVASTAAAAMAGTSAAVATTTTAGGVRSGGINKVIGGVRVARRDGKKIRKIQDYKHRLEHGDDEDEHVEEEEDEDDEDDDMPDV